MCGVGWGVRKVELYCFFLLLIRYSIFALELYYFEFASCRTLFGRSASCHEFFHIQCLYLKSLIMKKTAPSTARHPCSHTSIQYIFEYFPNKACSFFLQVISLTCNVLNQLEQNERNNKRLHLSIY